MRQFKWHVQYSITYCVFLLFSTLNFANNLSIQNARIASRDNVADEAIIQFDISWDNSWRDTEHWDAAWIFIKYRLQGATAAWSHATLSTTGAVAPQGSILDVSTDQKGVFIYRNAIGAGRASWENVCLVWDYGTDGLMDNAVVDIKVLGVEMVYVPTGAYWLGDGENRGGDQVYANFEAGTTGAAYQVTSEAAITLGGGTTGSLGNNNKQNAYCCGGLLNGTADDFDDVNTQTLPAAFPKGYQAFYCMKYEISQRDYVQFLNLIDATQAAFNTQTGHFVGGGFAANRYGITGSHPNYTTTEPYVPMIYWDWSRGAAYADWACLRPMSELEFEKACRGFAAPVMGEYPWGTADMDLSENMTLNNLSATNEGIATGYTVSATAGNCWMRDGAQTGNVIARVGIFAAHPNNTSRVTSGASYWGIMEMGGNAWERCVSVGHPQGRIFDGRHGDGLLHANGYANVANWPGQQFSPGRVESNMGMGYRGAGFEFPSPFKQRNARTSSRRLATEFWDITLFDDDFRFVRTAD